MINQAASKVQASGIRKTIMGVFALISVFIALIVYKVIQPRFLATDKMALNGLIVNEQKQPLAPFTLTTLNGQALDESSAKGRWSLWLFTHANCTAVCANRIAGVANWHKQLAPKLAQQTNLYAVTVNPGGDTAEQFNHFLTVFDPTMTGVTGEFLSIKRLASQLNIQFNKTTDASSNYSIDAKVAIVNPEGKFVGYFVPSFDLSKMNVTYRSLVTYY